MRRDPRPARPHLLPPATRSASGSPEAVWSSRTVSAARDAGRRIRPHRPPGSPDRSRLNRCDHARRDPLADRNRSGIHFTSTTPANSTPPALSSDPTTQPYGAHRPWLRVGRLGSPSAENSLSRNSPGSATSWAAWTPAPQRRSADTATASETAGRPTNSGSSNHKLRRSTGRRGGASRRISRPATPRWCRPTGPALLSAPPCSPDLRVSPSIRICAILNYLYAVLEAESRIALLAIGLDPGIGILHTDQRARDSAPH